MDRWGVQQAPREIEQDLTSRSIAALQAAGIEIPPYGLKLDGQTATLSGPVGAPIVSEEARLRVEAVWGVSEVVINAREVPPPPPADGAAAPPPPGKPVNRETAGAPPPQLTGKLEADLNKLMDGKTIRFSPNTDVLMPDGRRILDDMAKILNATPAVPLEISGHTDSDGDAQRNVSLSRRRAAAVKRYLVNRGVANGRLSSTGFGAAKPVAPNDSPEGKARNRRIEFHTVRNQ
jgi:peptidoglycan-binding protein ArfA